MTNPFITKGENIVMHATKGNEKKEIMKTLELLPKKTKQVLRLIAVLLLIHQSQATHSQTGCDPTVPSFVVDLSGSPTLSWLSPPVVREGNCCGTVSPDVCIEFIITLHPAANGIIFDIASGAVPPGGMFYQVDCGPPTPVGSP